MTRDTHPPFWLPSLQNALEEAQVIPMWEGSFSFSWDECTRTLRESLGLDELNVIESKAEWISESQLLDSLGDAPYIQGFDIRPLNEKGFLVIPQDDIHEIASWILVEEGEKEGLLDESIRKGFTTFLSLLVADAFRASTGGDLAPTLQTASLPQENCYSVDVQLTNKNRSIWARLLLPKSMQHAVATLYAQKKPSLIERAEKSEIPITTAITLGHVSLPQKALKSISEGDFVLLDYASYSPQTGKGTFQLVFEETPLFQVKVKDNSIKILDYPFTLQEKAMDDTFSDESFMSDLPEDAHKEPAHDESSKEEHDAKESDEETSSEQGSPLVQAQDVPLKLTVELGLVSIPLSKLVQLAPGNVIETGIHPEKPVRLTIAGQPVAEGMLTQVGECIGIQITKTAKHD